MPATTYEMLVDLLKTWVGENMLILGTADGMCSADAVRVSAELKDLVEKINHIRKFHDDNLADFQKVRGEDFSSVTFIRSRRNAEKSVETVRTLSI